MQMQMIGCSILSALMAEYATTVKSSDVGLAWEIHFKAKKQFELTDLKSIFTFCVQALKGKLPFRLFRAFYYFGKNSLSKLDVQHYILDRFWITYEIGVFCLKYHNLLGSTQAQ